MKPGDLVVLNVRAAMALWHDQAVYKTGRSGSLHPTDVSLVLATTKSRNTRFAALLLTSRGAVGWIAMNVVTVL